MTAKNSILLIINQSPGIDYNSLLNKIAPNYSNINSARAALSRAIKDLIIFGFLIKQKNNFFVTDKALAQINSEMKNKLLVHLNQTLLSKNSVSDADSVVRQLQMLIERSKQDTTLLKAAKGSTKFYIQDIADLEEKVSKQAKHHMYLQGVLSEQIKSLKELDFNDYRKLPLDSKTKDIVKKICRNFSIAEAVVECSSEEFLQRITAELSIPTRKNFSVKTEDLEKLFSVLEKQDDIPELYLFLSQIKVKITGKEAFFLGPSSSLKFLDT
jgi:hypothetical protein